MFWKKALVLAALQLFIDAFLHYSTYNYQNMHYTLYFKSLLLMTTVLFIFQNIIYFLKKKSRLLSFVTHLFLATTLTASTIISAISSKYLNEYISPYHINYYFSEYLSLDNIDPSSYLAPVANNLFISVSLVTVLTLIFYFILLVNPKHKFSYKPLTIVATFFLLINLHIIRHSHRNKLPATLSPIIAAEQYLGASFFQTKRATGEFKNTKKLDFHKSTLDRDSDIILIINESWGLKQLELSKKNSMPYFMQEITTKNWYNFSQTFTNSTSTELSTASILSGISPKEPSSTLFNMPMISNLAKKSNYKTIYYTSQNMCSLKEFIKSGEFDSIKSAPDFSFPIVNDNGIDDIATVKDLTKHIARNKKEKLFIVLFTNSLHGPYQRKSSHFKFEDKDLGPYEKALRILDKAIFELFRTLKKEKRFENSLIIATGDHGDYLNNKRKIPRLANYYDDFMRIPFYVKLPNNSQLNPKNNLFKNIQNLDIAPTIADFLGYCKNNSPQKFCSYYKGSSLFTNTNPKRVITGLSTNDIREWDPEGFALVTENKRVVVSSIEAPKVFDLQKDPRQQLATKKLEPILHQQIMKNPHLKRIYLKSLLLQDVL